MCAAYLAIVGITLPECLQLFEVLPIVELVMLEDIEKPGQCKTGVREQAKLCAAIGVYRRSE